MARTPEKAGQEGPEGREDRTGSRIPGSSEGKEEPPSIRDVNYPIITVPFDKEDSEREERTRDYFEDIERGFDLGDISGDFENVLEADITAANERELLGIIAESTRTLARYTQALVDIQSNMAVIQGEIAEYMAPYDGVVASGVEDIDNSGASQRLLDNVTDSTRFLLMRASPDNSEPIYIGGSNVEVGRGIEIRRGEYFNASRLNVNGAEMHIVSEEEGAELQVVALV